MRLAASLAGWLAVPGGVPSRSNVQGMAEVVHLHVPCTCSFSRLDRVSVAKHATLDFGFEQTLMVEWSLCCMVEVNGVDKEEGNAKPVRVWHGFCIHALEG